MIGVPRSPQNHHPYFLSIKSRSTPVADFPHRIDTEGPNAPAISQNLVLWNFNHASVAELLPDLDHKIVIVFAGGFCCPERILLFFVLLLNNQNKNNH